MGTAIGLAQLLEQGKDLDEKGLRRVAVLLRAADHLASCIRNLRDVGRIDASCYATDCLDEWDEFDQFAGQSELGSAAAEIMMQRVSHELRTRRFKRGPEAELQEEIAGILETAGLPFRREERLGPSERLDFYMPVGCVGIEVKVAGTPTQVLRQLLRYGDHHQVHGILLVTTRSKHRELPDRVRGKPLEVCYLCPI